MILLSDQLEDPASLLEIQKFNLSKIENSTEEVKIEINFTKEPRKSKKQLQKLIAIVEQFCKSKSQLAAEEGETGEPDQAEMA